MKGSLEAVDLCRKVLSGAAKDVPCWQFVRSITAEQWSQPHCAADALEVQFLKALKKSPESFSSTASSLLANLDGSITYDGLLAGGLAPLLVRILKSADYATMNSGVSIAKSLSSRLQQVESLQQLLSALVDALRGKMPGSSVVTALPNTAKIAVLCGIRHCFSSSRDKLQGLESSIVDGLFLFAQKEDDITLCMLAGQVLGELHGSFLSGNPSCASVAAQSASALQSPRASSRKFVLAWLCSMLRNCSTLTDAAIIDALFQIVSTNKGKPDTDILMIYSILAQVGTENTTVRERLRSLKSGQASLLSVLTAPQAEKEVLVAVSALQGLRDGHLSEDILAHLPAALSLQAQVLSTVNILINLEVLGIPASLCEEAAPLPSLGRVTAVGEAFARAIIYCYQLGLKQWMQEALAQVAAVRTERVGSILWSLLKTLDARHSASGDPSSVLFRRLPVDIVKRGDLITPVTERSVGAGIAAMLIALIASQSFASRSVSRQPNERAELLAVVALLCSYPTVSPSVKAARRLWGRLFKLGPLFSAEDCEAPLFADEVSQCLIAVGAMSSNPLTRRAGHRALVILSEACESCSPILAGNLLQSLSAHLIRSCAENSILALDDNSLRCVVDAESVIEEEFSHRRQQVTTTSGSVTNADRKKAVPRSARRGNFGADSVDADWADRVRLEQDQKARELQESADGSVREEVSSEVAARQHSTLLVVGSAQFLLECLAALALLSSDRANQCLEALMQSENLLKLLSSYVVGEFAQDALAVLVSKALPDDVSSISRDIASSLRLVAMHEFKDLNPISIESCWISGGDILAAASSLPDPFLRLFRFVNVFISSTSQNRSRSLNVFLLSFPVLRSVCLLKTNVGDVEMAFSLLRRVWPDKLHTSYVVAQGCELCLDLLALYPKAPLAADQLLGHIALGSCSEKSDVLAVLLGSKGLLHSDERVRLHSVRVVQSLDARGRACLGNPVHRDAILWMALFDPCVPVKETAMLCQPHFMQDMAENWAAVAAILTEYIGNGNEFVSNLSISAMGGLLASLISRVEFHAANQYLMSQFQNSFPPKQSDDPLGRSSRPSEAKDTTAPIRLGLARVYSALKAPDATERKAVDFDSLSRMLRFFIDVGVVDPNADVRAGVVSSAASIISAFGAEHAQSLIEYFEEILSRKPEPGTSLVEFDHRYAAAVVLLGSVGRHLSVQHQSFHRILQLLMDSLQIPSESVQRAVSECLIPIAQALKGTETMDALVQQTMEKVLKSASYGERRGAAFGLSAIVKGIGIPSLKSYNIVGTLKEACSSGSVSSRQGAMFAIELLTERLGLLFEPYVIGTIDCLLENFGHSSDHVRDAAQGAVKIIMTKLSAHGVKQILTPVVSTLNTDSAWKTRVEAIKMLGAMANCAPKQLSTCLPQIVPCLLQAGTDPHPKVRESAKVAMQSISSVIRNPEISKLSTVLLAALGDPSAKVKDALDALLQCEFMYTIDAPSLALLVPILSRALRDRSGDLKRKAAAITGNMMSMVSESGALKPYMTALLPGLKDCLIDPIPDVRASGAKALGSLVQGGEGSEADSRELMDWLFSTLRSVSSPVERSGAAQALAEICGGYNEPEKVEMVIAAALRCNIDDTSSGREGLMWFFSFLPYSLKERFVLHIGTALNSILLGLSDSVDSVRDVAMRAGKVVVGVLGANHANLIAPPLLSGICSEDWRIRLSSLQLLGDLVLLVGDARLDVGGGAADGEEELGGGASAVQAKMKSSFGIEQTYAILASIYVARADIVGSIRQHALQIWKVAVTNTPKTLVEVMPTLVDMLVAKLSSSEEDLRLIAGRSIGELVSKLGERVLSVIVPPLERGLDSADKSTRLGVCLGLGEVMSACTRKQAEDYLDSIIAAVSKALSDSSSAVCEQAAKVFLILYKSVGPSSIDRIVPSLLRQCEGDKDLRERALQGLRQVVAQRPRDILDYLLPRFLSEPLSSNGARALSAILDMSGSYLHFYFDKLLPTLIQEIHRAEERSSGSELEAEKLECLQEAALAALRSTTSNGLLQFVSEIGKQLDPEAAPSRRRWACWMVGKLFQVSKADYLECLPILLKYLLARVADTEQEVLLALRDCMSEMVSAVPLDNVMEHVDFIRNCITSTASSARHKTGGALMLSATGEFVLPLFTLPKSLDPFFAVFSHGLLNGSSIIKELSADMIAECADIATSETLKPTLLKVVGTLIRIVGDRYPSGVKAAILKALVVLMKKGGVSIKAFVPQLQTTFVKSLNDPLREVRQRGCSALVHLLQLGPRVDPLLSDLANLCMQVDSHAIRLSVLDALGIVLTAAGSKATPAVQTKVVDALIATLNDSEDMVKLAAGRCLGMVSYYLSESSLSDLLLDLIGKKGEPGALSPSGRVIGLACALQGGGMRGDELRQEIFDILLASNSGHADRSDNTSLKFALGCALVVLVSVPSFEGSQDRQQEYKTCAQNAVHFFSSTLASLASFPSSDVRTQALLAIRKAAKAVYGATSQHMRELFPPVIAATKDVDLRVKLTGENAAKCLIEGKSGALGGGGSPAFQQFLARLDDENLGRAIRECLRRGFPSATEGAAEDDPLQQGVLTIFGFM